MQILSAQEPIRSVEILKDSLAKLEYNENWHLLTYVSSMAIATLDTLSTDSKKFISFKELNGLVKTEFNEEALFLADGLSKDTTLTKNEYFELQIRRSEIYANSKQEFKSHQALDRIAAKLDDVPTKMVYPEYYLQRALVFYKFHKDNVAKVYATQFLNHSIAVSDSLQMARGYQLLGFLATDEPNEDFKNLHKAYDLFTLLKYEIKIAQTAIRLANAYNNLGDKQNALLYVSIAEKNLNNTDNSLELAKFSRTASVICESNDLFERALMYERRASQFFEGYYARQSGIRIRQIEFANRQMAIEQEENAYKENILELKKERFVFISIGIVGGIFIALISLLFARNKRISRKIKHQNTQISEQNVLLEKSVDEKQILLKELNHRVKNNLALIISLIKFQFDSLHDSEDKQKVIDLENRIRTISFAHEQFVYADQTEATLFFNLKQYIKNICGSLVAISTRTVQITLDIKNIQINIDTALPIGIIINELFTNSIEHAETVDETLKISISIAQVDDIFTVDYHDNGTVFVKNKDSSTSLGLFIINSMVKQLDGDIAQENSYYTIKLRTK